MTDMPDMDPRWPRLLAAARSWRASMIPNTSVGIYGPTRVLIEAIEDFDEGCQHPRDQRVFSSSGGPDVCGKCGAALA